MNVQWNKLFVGALHSAAGACIKHGWVHASVYHWLAGLALLVIGYVTHNPAPVADAKADLGQLRGIVKLALLGAFLSLFMTGCAITRKGDITKHPVREYVVDNGNGTIVAPAGVQVVMVTNAPRFSLKGLFFGYSGSYLVRSDEPSDRYTGSGKFLLADPAFAALSSQHTNQTVLGGNSTFSVGSATITVSTNGIQAVGTAGSELINSIGGAIGTAAGKAVKTP